MVDAQPKLKLEGWLMLDSFIIASEKRAIGLFRRGGIMGDGPAYCTAVFIPRQNMEGFPICLSTNEYHFKPAAQLDFETRRPKMRDAGTEDMPMQKGKRLIQEVMQEKLGES